MCKENIFVWGVCTCVCVYVYVCRHVCVSPSVYQVLDFKALRETD